MMVLASWRLVEFFHMDKFPLLPRLRKRFPALFSCTRCLSVWCSAAVITVYLYLPYGNWPLGLSMLFMIQNAIMKRVTR